LLVICSRIVYKTYHCGHSPQSGNCSWGTARFEPAHAPVAPGAGTAASGRGAMIDRCGELRCDRRTLDKMSHPIAQPAENGPRSLVSSLVQGQLTIDFIDSFPPGEGGEGFGRTRVRRPRSESQVWGQSSGVYGPASSMEGRLAHDHCQGLLNHCAHARRRVEGIENQMLPIGNI
jgi:hypothetical protein